MPLTHAVYTPNGEHLATTGFDGFLRLWRVDEWQEVAKLKGNQSPLWTVDFDPKGKRLAMGGDFEVMVYERKKKGWELAEQLPIEGMGGPKGGSVFDLTFSNDGKLLFVGTFDCAVDVWDTKKWKRKDQCKEHEGFADGEMIEFLHMHPDGKTLLAGGKTKTTRILRYGKVKPPADKPKKDRKKTKTRKKGWTTVQAFPDPKRDDGHPTHRMCGRFAPDGSVFALGGTDGMLQIIDCETWEETQTLQAHPGQFSAALAFHPTQPRLWTAGEDLKLWDTQTWKVIASVAMPVQAQHMSMSPTGHQLAVAGTDGTLRIYGMPEVGVMDADAPR